ncbi:hypothetical protein T492DRAFT_284073 [Pavlovales sp. CCMP2436]|nr:hypothetical protein T492DRAFT_284073 [Pavlovales sp. CCMP2436]
MLRPVFSCPRADELAARRRSDVDAPAAGCSCATARVLILLGVLVGALWVLPESVVVLGVLFGMLRELLEPPAASCICQPLRQPSASICRLVKSFNQVRAKWKLFFFKTICFLFKVSFRLPTYFSSYLCLGIGGVGGVRVRRLLEKA